ncbi:MAG TPA: MFS transporter [Rhodopila sp.]|uniref:MFS transporter n=1 Tax=Rhodopila sp. TaxID=2480087 RepID=UPI002D1AFE28|nr:MFS transporter [Rhodopila sp.]HVY13603.1 MFS transporter [Rhodopila sp.]
MRRDIDSPYAWLRLAIALVISGIGGVGMWSVVVSLPAVQAGFGADRGAATLPYTCVSVGIGLGSLLMGRLLDRVGLIKPLLIGATTLGAGYVLASLSGSIRTYAAIHLFIGMFGSAATFVPIVSDISLWFERRRGIAVALASSGSYVAGVFWPSLIELMIQAHGWRYAHLMIGIICVVTIPPLALLLRGPGPSRAPGAPPPLAPRRRVDLPPRTLQALLAVAGLACCVAMSMPQVHIVAYCGDLGYGAASGARMLSLMLGFGIVSRIASGFLSDRVGGLVTLLIGSVAQMVALLLYLSMDGLAELYVISSLFGLFQGGLVPSYAIIVRENFPAGQTGSRVGLILTMTLLGMGLGGWMSGVIYDWTGSYLAAFANGVAWNVGHLMITLFLLSRSYAPTRQGAPRSAVPLVVGGNGR